MEILGIILSLLLFLHMTLKYKLGLIFSISSALILYIAISLIFTKEPEEITEIEKTNLSKKGKDSIIKISKYQTLIENKTIKDNIKVICDISNKIIDTAEKGKKTNDVKKFINYYLPFTLNILNQYNEIEDKNLSSKESKEFMKKVETLTDKVKIACENTLNSLYEGVMINTNADIKVFEGMLKSDGLVDDNMKIRIGSEK